MESKSFNLAQDELPSWINATLGELTIQGKFLELSEFCEQVIQEYPNSIIVWNNLGNSYRQLQKFAEASNAFRKLLALNPTLSDGHSNLGATFQDISAFNVAIECYKTAICLDSNNLNAHYNMGLALKSQGKYRDAITCFNRALVLKNDFVEAHCNLADAYRCEGRLTEAKEAFNKAFSIQPDNVFAKHMLDALKGQKTKSPPEQFVEQLFDQYAPTFEYELVEKLRYNLPATLATLIFNRADGKVVNSVLDMGCGTGLFGAEIRSFCQTLEGVDISKQMLQVAKHKSIYDRLTHKNIRDFLSETELNFDYFVAADVFEYVGDLSEIFNLIGSKNQKRATLIFSTEHSETCEYWLENTGRYSHSKLYIEKLCCEFGYTLSHFEIIKLRKEMHSFLDGGVYILESKVA